MEVCPDTTLFFAHSSSVTIWDVQTGGLIHTFTTQPKVNDIAISTSGDHIAWGSSNGSVGFWNIHTKIEGRGFRNSQPVVTICWLSPQKLAVATQDSLCVHSITAGETLDSLPFPGHVWGMVHLDTDKFLVGTSKPGLWVDRELYAFETISNQRPEPLERRRPAVDRGQLVRRKICREKQSPTHPGQLTHPTLVGKWVACITPPSGVQLFSTKSYDWTKNPPLLGAATSVVASSNRNIVVQAKDSIQIFSVDVLASREVGNDTRPYHVYPLGENYIFCVLQPARTPIIINLETLQEISRNDETFPFRPLVANELEFVRVLFAPEVVETFDILIALRTWWSGISLLPKRIETTDKDTPPLLYGLSPARTKMATYYQEELWVNDTEDGHLLAGPPTIGDDLGEVYDLVFDSETRIYLKIDGPGKHFQIPFDITPSTSPDQPPHCITRGEPMPLSEPRATPPYTLDANCEWVLDAQSRKVCWISPRDIRRGNGGHLWAGTSLVMVGDDGVVRKVTFKEPDC